MLLYLTKLGLGCVLHWALWNLKFSSKTDYVTHIYVLFCKKCQIPKIQKVSQIFDYDLFWVFLFVFCFFFHFQKSFSFLLRNNYVCFHQNFNHLWTEYAYRSKFFRIFTAKQIFKILLTKRKLIRYSYFINIYMVYWSWAFILIKCLLYNFSVMKFHNFYPFLIMVLIFLYNFF